VIVLDEAQAQATDFLQAPATVDLLNSEPVVIAYTAPRTTLILGSRQKEELVDLRAAQERGVAVARRRTGGGAVLVDPVHALWIDVLLPREHALWLDDVRSSPHWLGDCWREALGSLGVAGEVHRGGLENSAWGSLICFAAVGPGEVSVGGRKIVGISQRRTRDGARFQCLIYERWDATGLIDLLELSPEERSRARAELGQVADGPGTRLDDVRDAVLGRLQTALT
jgi:lipoate-protein ligase A